MTSTSIRLLPRARATRQAAAIEHDHRLLADQLSRCATPSARWMHLRSLGADLRAFTAAHLVSVVAIAALVGGGLWMYG